MVDKVQEDEFMKQYMETCKEQIEKLAKNPELLTQTLKPFMHMSQQLMTGGMIDGALPADMDINRMIALMIEMVNYIKGNHKKIMQEDEALIQELDEHSKRLRSLIKKLIEKIENK
ncbi:hypothetical protein [Wolbachia endosymbiont of Ctenocephalides felis wCfeT]|uniref:hypothetical protein n=1 Tax=Wolbachia endosymbiont of Ctenocephalides felis wCfeT TaxID=2732593 RepID=UPI00144610F8|nr:hypothetical protein [Wolbachia endosymbiont of Ctenocephalides felis wCfeT]